jgi:porin-like protein
VSRQISVRRRGACIALLGVCWLWSPAARAEVTIAEQKGFRFYTEGRINAFASLGFGDDFPQPSPDPSGGMHSVVGATALGAAGQNTEQDDANNKYFAIRGRNGFMATILGFGIARDLTATTKVKGYIALWGHAETYERDRSYTSEFDVREGYVNFDGPWGGFTAGRMLGLFGRISTEIDFNYGHNFGLGYPCGDGQGPTCGHIGTGVMFPGFASGFAYATPTLAGLKLQVGLFDPVRVLGAWNRAPMPRPEAALSFEQKLGATGLLKLQAEGMVQPVARGERDASGASRTVTDEVWGVAGGGRLEVGPVRFGAAVFRGKGLGQYYALQNSPVAFSPATYELRSFTGLYAQAAVVFGSVQLAAGAGQVRIDQLEIDKRDAALSNAKSQTGISAAIYYALSDNLVLGLDYFRFQTDWYGAPTLDPTSMAVTGRLAPEKQVVNYINAGATYHW